MRATWKKQPNYPLNELYGNLVLAHMEACGEETVNANAFRNEFASASNIFIGRCQSEAAALRGGSRARHWCDIVISQHRRVAARAIAEGKQLNYLFVTFSEPRKEIDYWLIPAATMAISEQKVKIQRKVESIPTHIKRQKQHDERDVLFGQDVTRFRRSIPFGVDTAPIAG